MADAQPLDALRSAPPARKQKLAATATVAAPAPAPATVAAKAKAVPKGTLFGGTRLVGTFFGSSTTTGTNWSCTGSVLDTAARNVVLTAAHCALGYGNTYVFVPQFKKGAGPAQQPYGIFPIQRVLIDPRYQPDKPGRTTKKAVSDLDTAFARVSANQRGQKLQDAVGGGLTFTRPTGYTNKNITVVGYPGKSHNPAGKAVKCTVPTSQLPGFRQMSMTCGGYYGGVSGSPWITDYKDGAGTGHVIGNLGGYNGGGNDADVDYISYAPAFGADAANLLAVAVANRPLPTNLPPYQGVQAKLPGGAGTLQHANLPASGDCASGRTGDDLVVRWSDGGTTLYADTTGRRLGSGTRLVHPRT
ncbi:trypsin-like serine protease [Streptomyces sp. NPDC048664]|uniref:trypsin-like serine peptidase n=1 Tax=Streptomyces sp. NPDC048664 TaxID=3154505 RepID=UPI00343A0264